MHCTLFFIEQLLGVINPICNTKNGFYEPLQVIMNSSPGNVCVTLNGTVTSQPFMGGAGQCLAGGVFVPALQPARSKHT